MSHLPTNSPHGLLDDRGIPGNMCPRSLLIGWVNPSRGEGLWIEKKERKKVKELVRYHRHNTRRHHQQQHRPRLHYHRYPIVSINLWISFLML